MGEIKRKSRKTSAKPAASRHRSNSKLNATDPQNTAADITAPITAAEKSSADERLYRLFAENYSDALWMMDINLAITYVSPSAERRRGYSAEELIDLPLDKQVTPQSLSPALETFAQILKQMEEGPKDLRIERDTGSRVHLQRRLNNLDGMSFYLNP